MKDRRSLLHLAVLLFSFLLLVDQYWSARVERTTYLDHAALIQKQVSIHYSRWRRWDYRPGPRWSLHTYGHWYIAHLDNGRWFQLNGRDNGVLQHRDSVTVEVAPLTGRVLSFRPAKDNKTRETADALKELVPFHFLLGSLSLWLLVGTSRADGRYYLHFLLIVLGISFLIALFAMTYPLMWAMGLVPFA